MTIFSHFQSVFFCAFVALAMMQSACDKNIATDDSTDDEDTVTITPDINTTDDETDDEDDGEDTTDDDTADTNDTDTTDDVTDTPTDDDDDTAEDETPSGNAGDLDADFGTSGVTTHSFGDDSGSAYTDDYAMAAAQTSDGKLVVAGYSSTSAGKDGAVLLLDENGTVLDSLTTDLGSGGDEFLAVAVSSNTVYAVGKSNSDIALARYTIASDSITLDTTFGTDGLQLQDLDSSTDYGYDVYIATDGKILVAGYSNVNGTGDFVLARFDTTGNLDTTFGDASTGYVATDLGSSVADTAMSLAVDSANDKIYLGGYTTASLTNGITDLALARYTLSTGVIDTTFGGGDGIETFNTGTSGANEAAYDIALLDGKVVLGGRATVSAKGVFAAVCYDTSAAALDTSFGGGDGIVTSAGVWSYNSSAKAVVADSNGKIVLGGWYSTISGSTASPSGFALIRYDSTGTADTDFGTDGVVSTSVGSNGDYIEDLVLDSAGDIIAIGKTKNADDHYDIAIVKYHGSAF